MVISNQVNDDDDDDDGDDEEVRRKWEGGVDKQPGHHYLTQIEGCW